MKYVLTAIAVWSIFLNAAAQDRSRNVWCFGDSVVLDFNSGTPVSATSCSIATNEGSASVADKTTGALLFYTDGVSVWDSTNTIMPSDTVSLGGNSQTTQSALIVPYPGSATKYYVFTADFQAGLLDYIYGPGTAGLSYSIVDMSLNGGLGDVAQQPQVLLTPTCEKITATKMPNNAGYWVVTHQWGSKKFYAYPVTAAGIGAPVISTIGLLIQDQGSYSGWEAIGYMKISPDGSKIAVAHDYGFHTVQVFNFNNVTGVLSGSVLSDNTLSVYDFFDDVYSGPYGLSFSPNSKLLYITVDQSTNIYQYNLAAGNAAAVLASRNIIGTAIDPFALQMGPDLKIYMIDNAIDSLDRIDSPDVYGIGCHFTTGAVPINYGTPILGLPDFVENFYTPVNDTLTFVNCSGDSMIAFLDTTLSGTPVSFWNFGDTASGVLDTTTVTSPVHNFSSSGNYTVTLYINTGIDSFTIVKNISVHNSAPAIQISADTGVCINQSAQLSANISNAQQYLWSPVAGLSCVSCSNPVATPDSTTEYYVQATDLFGCTTSDSVKVTLGTAAPITITSDRDTICSGDSAHVCAPAGEVAYQWNIGSDTSTCMYATGAGNYYVTVTEQGGCTATSNHVAINTYAAQQVQISANGDTLFSYNGVTYQWLLNGNAIQGATMSSYVVTQTGYYSVEVSDNHGCYEISQATQIVLTGVQQPNGNEWVKVYPNPSTNGNWQVATSAGLIGSTVEIYDDNGRLVYKTKIRNQLTNITPDIARGIYTLRVTFGNDSYNLKLVRL